MAQVQTVEVTCVRAGEEKVGERNGTVFSVAGGVREGGLIKRAGVTVTRNVYIDMICFDDPSLLLGLEPGKVYAVTGEWRPDDYNGREGLKVVVSHVEEVVYQARSAAEADGVPSGYR